MDNTLQTLFLFSAWFSILGGFGHYTYPAGTNGLIAFISLFFIFRVFNLIASLLLVRGQALTAFVKMALTFASLIPLVVLFFWGFIAGEIALNPTKPPV
jgi:hypothetical protein